MKKFILALVALVSGYFAGWLTTPFAMGLLGNLFIAEWDGWSWLALAILAVVLSQVVGVILAILCGLIAWGKFGSEHWRVNRYIICIIIPLLLIAISLIVPQIISEQTKNNCLNLPAGASKDRCLDKLSISNNGVKDATYCGKISGHDNRFNCLYGIYHGAKLPDCSQLDDQDNKDACYSAQAERNINNPDPSKIEPLCDLIHDTQTKDYCYRVYAPTPTSCPKISTPDNVGACYSSVALRTGEVKWCDKITAEGYEKNGCYSYFVNQKGRTDLCPLIKSVDPVLLRGCPDPFAKFNQ